MAQLIDRLCPASTCAGLVTVFNAYTEDNTGFTRRRELPDGNATLLVNLGDPLRIDHPANRTTVFAAGIGFYSGPSSSYAVSETDGAQAGAQVMLTLLGARRLLGIPLKTVGDALTDPVDLLGETMRDTVARLQDAPDHAARLAILDQSVTSRLLASDAAPPADIVWALSRLRATAGRISVQALANDIGCSRKHLTARFSHEFGLPPKALARVLRFAHAMRHVRARRSASWAEIAAACGYADQSHLTHDFYTMAGDSPRRLAARALPDDAVLSTEKKSVPGAAGSSQTRRRRVASRHDWLNVLARVARNAFAQVTNLQDNAAASHDPTLIMQEYAMTAPAVDIIPYLFCRDVPAALDWLARVFGLTEDMRHATARGTHGEMRLGDRRIMLGAPNDAHGLRSPATLGSATQGVFVYVPDVIAHHAHTVAAGGSPEGTPTDHGYGLTYTVHDLDGHPWYFTQQPT